jgi:hypothetical protein
MTTIKPKNWEEFQHYKDRSPPWIKLHKKLLDDYEFHRLPVASRALAPMLWLIASEYKDGKFELDYDMLTYRLRMSENDLREAMEPLIKSGHFIVDSATLAVCKPDARLGRGEKSREEADAQARVKHLANETTDDALLLLDRLNEILGIDPAKQINPNWHKTQIRLCREWIALGRTPEQITAIVSAVAERQRGADPNWRASTVKYFDAAVRQGETPKPADPLRGWKPKGSYTEKELDLYRKAAPIAEARNIPEKAWRTPQGRDWTLRLDSFAKSQTKRWPDAWGDPPGHKDCTCPAEILAHFSDVRANT